MPKARRSFVRTSRVPSKNPSPPQEVSLGILGLGKLGRGILFGACEKDWVNRIHAYSGSYGGNYSSVENDLFAKREKVLFHHTIQGVLDANPQLLFVTTGARIEDFTKYTTRVELHERLYDEAIPHLRPIFEALRNYQGLICIMTNPTGDHLYAAHDVFGIPEYQLTSFPPDTRRGVGLIGRCLENFCLLKRYKIAITPDSILSRSFSDLCRLQLIESDKNDLERKIVTVIQGPGKIHLDVVGEHGKEIPLLDTCMLDQEKLSSIHPVFKETKFKQAFTMELRSIGLRLMKALETSKGSYYTSPSVALEVAERLLCPGRAGRHLDPKQCVYAYHERLRAFLSMPAHFWRAGLRVEPPAGWWDGLRLDIQTQLIGQAEAQKDSLARKDRDGKDRRAHWRLKGMEGSPSD